MVQENTDETEEEVAGETIRCQICGTIWYQDQTEISKDCEHLRFIYSFDGGFSYYGDWDVASFEESIKKARQENEDFDIEEYLDNLDRIHHHDIDGTISASSEYYEEIMGVPFRRTIWGYKKDFMRNGPLKSLDKAIEMNPRDAEAWFNKGNVLSRLRRFNGAIQAYEKAIEIEPQYVAAWNNKGNILRNLGKFDKAIEAFDKAIEIDPQFIWAWNNKGIALKNLGKYTEAIQAYEKAIEIDPKFAHPWYNKGNALKNIHKYEDAIEAYNKAIDLNLNDADAWHNKGKALKSWSHGRGRCKLGKSSGIRGILTNTAFRFF